MKKLITLLFLLILLAGCGKKGRVDHSGDEVKFTFAFLTDIHLQPELNAVEGFKKAIDTINEIDPDFVLTGGDLVRDALGQTYGRADSLYNLYNQVVKGFNMPVYNTMGNHEIFGWYRDEKEIRDNVEYGKRMFEHRIGKRFYSFDHKGWHFIVLDALGRAEDGGYIGKVEEEQVEWLKKDLETLDKKIPIIVSVHIPFITTQTQLLQGSQAQNPAGLVITNSREVLQLLYPYNLKLVLQGHLHFLEDMYIQNRVHFITGGAVCGRWWANKPGSYPQEGFLLVKVKEGSIDWEYVDFGWTTPFEQ